MILSQSESSTWTQKFFFLLTSMMMMVKEKESEVIKKPEASHCWDQSGAVSSQLPRKWGFSKCDDADICNADTNGEQQPKMEQNAGWYCPVSFP